MDAVNSQAAWDEAAERVLAYFQALQVGGLEHRTRETLRVLEAARGRCAADPALPPVTAALTEAAESLRAWYADAVPGASLEHGLAAALAVEAPQNWPDAVLSHPVPPALAARLAEARVSIGPELAPSSMAAREMNFGAMETIAQGTWQQFAWAPVLRAAALWTAIFFLALYTWDKFFAS
jgi:hypothetical protein